MKILMCVLYGLMCLGVFVYFMKDKPHTTIHLTTTEYVIVTLFLSLLSPVSLVILVIGYPFYWLHRLFHRDDVKPINDDDDDDDETQGFDYEEHEDWCDGNTEYEEK